jgi:hypothetical protein
MNVQAVEPTQDTAALLAGAQFSDAFAIAIGAPALDARQAAEKMLGRSPRWIGALMAVRDTIVAPFDLKTSSKKGNYPDSIGIFPVLSQSPGRLVAGFDDRHLDFRVVVDVAPSGAGQEVTATTLVLTHNRLGKVYLAIILPFHRLVVRSLLRQVAV